MQKSNGELKQELADLKAELANAISLKNTYHDNWQDAKGTIDSQAEVINNLTVRWGKVCRELADLKEHQAELEEEYDRLDNVRGELWFELNNLKKLVGDL